MADRAPRVGNIPHISAVAVEECVDGRRPPVEDGLAVRLGGRGHRVHRHRLDVRAPAAAVRRARRGRPARLRPCRRPSGPARHRHAARRARVGDAVDGRTGVGADAAPPRRVGRQPSTAPLRARRAVGLDRRAHRPTRRRAAVPAPRQRGVRRSRCRPDVPACTRADRPAADRAARRCGGGDDHAGSRAVLPWVERRAGIRSRHGGRVGRRAVRPTWRRPGQPGAARRGGSGSSWCARGDDDPRRGGRRRGRRRPLRTVLGRDALARPRAVSSPRVSFRRPSCSAGSTSATSCATATSERLGT